MWYIIGAVIIYFAGWITSYFVMRNNPKYFNLDKMAKDELRALADKVKE